MNREALEAQFEQSARQLAETSARAQAESDRIAAQRTTVRLARAFYMGWGAYLAVWGVWLIALQPRHAPSYDSLGEDWAWWAVGCSATLVGVIVTARTYKATRQPQLAVIAVLCALMALAIVLVFVASGSLSTGVPTYTAHAAIHTGAAWLLRTLHRKRPPETTRGE